MSFLITVIVFVTIISIIGGANFYVAKRIYQCVNFFLPNLRFFICLIFFVAMTLIMIMGFANSFLPIGQKAAHILDVISSYWMGFFMYLLIFIILSDAAMLVIRLVKSSKWKYMPALRMITVLTAVIFTIVTVTYGLIHVGNIKHVSYNIELSDKKMSEEINLVLITDLHLGSARSEARLNGIVNEINSLQPDVVCIAGDFFNTDFNSIQNVEETAQILKTISAKYGVYACLGNHDGGKTLDKMLDFLEQCKIKALNDEYVTVDNLFTLVGRLDASAIGGYNNMTRKSLSDVLEGTDKTLPIIVMDHNPACISEYSGEVDLVLSGHTHKGQVFPGSLITNAMYIVDYGHYVEENGTQIIVSSGIGTWGPPMRVGSNSEIVSVYFSLK